ncbi:hypothetical protein HY995_03260 [Candidatus Micrarchaeota archaeon]|nr:hypothetical protein [Candidatus Micrarchaeota archaeon]MBI5177080.1 hypothetical protein [Candidatus Micrarchaeota archaeon]
MAEKKFSKLANASNDEGVVFYSIPNNPLCTQLRNGLARGKVKFVEKDITTNPAAFRELVEKTQGAPTVPLVSDGLRMLKIASSADVDGAINRLKG